MLSSVETTEHYSGSGSLFGRGTNTATGNTAETVLQRVDIVRYLTKTKGRTAYSIAMGFIKREVLSKNGEQHVFLLTKEGWEYWNEVEIGEKQNEKDI